MVQIVVFVILITKEDLPPVANFSTPFETKDEDGTTQYTKNAMYKTSMCSI